MHTGCPSKYADGKKMLGKKSYNGMKYTQVSAWQGINMFSIGSKSQFPIDIHGN